MTALHIADAEAGTDARTSHAETERESVCVFATHNDVYSVYM